MTAPGKMRLSLAERDAAHDRDAVDQLRAAADPDLRADDAERADPDVVVQLGPRIDDRGWFDVGGHGRDRGQESGVRIGSGYSEP